MTTKLKKTIVVDYNLLLGISGVLLAGWLVHAAATYYCFRRGLGLGAEPTLLGVVAIALELLLCLTLGCLPRFLLRDRVWFLLLFLAFVLRAARYAFHDALHLFFASQFGSLALVLAAFLYVRHLKISRQGNRGNRGQAPI